MDYLVQLDHNVFTALNGLHDSYFDHLMWIVAATPAWVPMILVLLWLLWRRGGWKATLLVVTALAITILISDQVASSVCKPLFQRLRPSHDPLLASTIHLVNGYTGGQYGFISSHASNAFGAATLLMLIFRNRRTTMALTLWAVIVCYCRIYEGVHFPGDILCGAVVGVLAAFLVFYFFKKALKRFCRRTQLFDDAEATAMSLAVIVNLLLLTVIANFHTF